MAQALADAPCADLVELQAEGLSLRAIADRLNVEGHSTRQGRPWNLVQVTRVLERAGV